MTLIQKLNDSIITNINIVESENRMCYDYNHLELAENCEKIADEFAIGFADWCKQEYDVENTPFHNKWRDVNGEYRESKELLEIYKKEKGL